MYTFLFTFAIFINECIGNVDISSSEPDIPHMNLDPDVGADIANLITRRGYPIEEHFVETSDGWVLGVYRIPYGKSGKPSNNSVTKPVIMLQHGLLDSSYTWINNFENQSFAYILADHGYDVWLGNNRGNKYSKRHTQYKDHQYEFWNFTYDEMAGIDTPETIEYILEKTGQKKLAYIGHSQGTIQFFAMPTLRPDIVPKIAFFGALAPIAYENHCKSLVFDILAELDVPELFEYVGRNQFLPGDILFSKIDPRLCTPYGELCNEFLALLCGPSKNLNISRIPVYLSALPAGTSVKNMQHWQQDIKKNYFRRFDYGSKEKNEEHYGPNYPEPPQYNLSMVTFPVGLYSGTDDWLADPTDVNHLIEGLPPSSIAVQSVTVGFAHLDFVWSIYAAEKIYYPMLPQLQRYLGPGVL